MQNKRLYVIIKRESEVIFVRLTDFGVVVLYSPVGEVDLMTPIYPRERLLETKALIFASLVTIDSQLLVIAETAER